MRFHPQSSATPLGRPKEVKKWEKSPLYLFYLTAFMPFLVVNEVNNENKITTKPARVGRKLLELKSKNIFLCLLTYDLRLRASIWKAGDLEKVMLESSKKKVRPWKTMISTIFACARSLSCAQGTRLEHGTVRMPWDVLRVLISQKIPCGPMRYKSFPLTIAPNFLAATFLRK